MHYDMHLLHVIASMNPVSGGPCQGIRNLDKASHNINIHREVVCLDDPASLANAQDLFPIHALGCPSNPWGYNSKLIPWLTENVERFDTIIVNGLWLFPSYATWKVINNLKNESTEGKKLPNLFIMPHGMLDPWFQHGAGRMWKAIRNRVYWYLLERRVVNDADGLLFTCETELVLARQSFNHYHPKQEVNVGYGINEPPPFSNHMQMAFLKKCPEINQQNYLLFLGRIHQKKGIDMLIKSYIKILTENPDGIISLPRLVIAGPGQDSQFGKELLKIIARNPQLKKIVYFVGMLTGEAKWGAIYGCEAFILPSHQENFGIAVAESLACSKPVLISNQVNIWREIESEGGGFIECDSLDGTAALINRWILLSTEKKSEMSKMARLTYEKFFKVEPVAIRLFNALKS